MQQCQQMLHVRQNHWLLNRLIWKSISHVDDYYYGLYWDINERERGSLPLSTDFEIRLSKEWGVYIYFFSPPNLAIFKYLFCIICESILFHLIIGSRYTGKYQFVHQIPYSVIKWQEHTFVENTIIKALCHSWCLGKMPNTLTIP